MLGQLEKTLLELSSLGQQQSATSAHPSPGVTAFRETYGNPSDATTYGGGGGSGGRSGGAEVMAGGASTLGVASGGIFGEAALPAWRQLLDRVKMLSRCV